MHKKDLKDSLMKPRNLDDVKISESVIEKIYQRHSKQTSEEMLQNYPIVRNDSLLNGVAYVLRFLACGEPTKVIELFKQLKENREIREEDMKPSQYYFGRGLDLKDYALSFSNVILTALNRDLRIEIITKIVLLLSDFDIFKDKQERIKSLEQYQIDSMLADLIGANDETASLSMASSMLDLWVNGIKSRYMDLYFQNLPTPHYRKYKFNLMQSYGLAAPFCDNHAVKVNLARLKQKVDDYVKSAFDFSSLEEYILDVFKKDAQLNYSSGSWIYINSSNTAALPYGYDDESDVKSFLSEAISDYLLCEIHSYYGAYYASHNKPVLRINPGNYNIEQVLNNRLSPYSVNKMVRTANICGLVFSCIWAVRTRIIRKSSEDLLDSLFESLTTLESSSPYYLGKKVKLLEKENKTLLKKVDSLNILNRRLKSELSAAQNNTNKSGAKKDNGSVAYKSQTLKLQKRLDKMQDDYEKMCNENEALKEKIAVLIENNNKESTVYSVDVNKRYLFVVDNERLQARLRAWFPNAVISARCDIRFSNKDNYYMAVFMTGEVSHSEYTTYKSKCFQYNIPIANCNFVNFDRVCESISQAEEEYHLS